MTPDNNLLTNIERKLEVLSSSSSLLSLHTMSLSLTVDICRLTTYFELLLEQWQRCLPLGEACDVNFSSWGAKVWDMLQAVRKIYMMHDVKVYPYEYESESYVDFKEALLTMAYNKSSLSIFRDMKEDDVPIILVCALRGLNEVLMEISEFLNSPTEELIEISWQKWQENYRKHYLKACEKEYNKWKIAYSKRTLKKYLREKSQKELAEFKERFLNESEFEQVFDVEEQKVDIDGLSRFLFTHGGRFGISHIDERPMFSKELVDLFNFVELWAMMQNDLQPSKKQKEKDVQQEDELKVKVFNHLAKLNDIVAEDWRKLISRLWESIFVKFRKEIAQAGKREKFKDFSKKTLYSIIGYLKKKWIFLSDVTEVQLTILLENEKNGMRKYINCGLMSLDESLAKEMKSFIDNEIAKLKAKR